MWNGSIALPKRITEGQDKEGFSEGGVLGMGRRYSGKLHRCYQK